MPPGVCKRVQAGVCAAVKAWPLWELPRWLVVFIAFVSVSYVAAIGLALSTTHVTAHDLLVFGALLVCIAVTVELTKRAGENAGFIKDVYGVWDLPVAILLPPAYALIAPLVQYSLVQWRIRRIALHKRVFSLAAVGVSYGLVSVVFHAAAQSTIGLAFSLPAHVPAWLMAVAAAAVLLIVVNQALVLPAVKGSDPSVRIRDIIVSQERVQNDIAELCVAVVVTLGIAFSLLTVVFALPFVTLLQRSMRHSQLVNASRVDSKTGLLNAGTWEREAASEVARALRTRTPLALVLIDIDRFKMVNDMHGHLTGDKALRAIARTFRLFLREYDLGGRFGGEEFALLLPHTGAADARQIAERMRRHIEEMPISTSDDPGAESLHVTVSIGVAALGTAWDRTSGNQFTDMLAAADSALYRAKNAGRNQVWMVTDNAMVAAAGRDHLAS